MEELFTIGHSVAKVDFVIELLELYKIQWLIDVRSVPFSSHAPQFNKDIFANRLNSSHIKYWSMGKYFGARWPCRELYTSEGYLDFEKVRQQTGFIYYMDSVMRGLLEGNRIALMCTEKDPFDCHRAILVSRAFELQGVHVSHILHNGGLRTQEELGKQLLKRYFPECNQMDLFSENGYEDESTLLIQAYQKRNADIGYRWGQEDEKVNWQ